MSKSKYLRVDINWKRIEKWRENGWLWTDIGRKIGYGGSYLSKKYKERRKK